MWASIVLLGLRVIAEWENYRLARSGWEEIFPSIYSQPKFISISRYIVISIFQDNAFLRARHETTRQAMQLTNHSSNPHITETIGTYKNEKEAYSNSIYKQQVESDYNDFVKTSFWLKEE